MKPNPFLQPSALESLSEPTETEIAAFWRMNPEMAERVFGRPKYEGGIEPDESLVAA